MQRHQDLRYQSGYACLLYTSEKQAGKPKTRQRVLVVEDEEEIRTYLKQELSDEYKVAICCNGKEACDYILKEMPDLVISDIIKSLLQDRAFPRNDLSAQKYNLLIKFCKSNMLLSM